MAGRVATSFQMVVARLQFRRVDVMKVSRIIEAPIRSEPDAAGWAFSVGERFLITLTFRTIEEANVARRAMSKLLNDAAEVAERWNPSPPVKR